jgi:hypothetical protein
VTVGDDASLTLPPPRLLRWEVFTVFALSLGASGLNALLSLIGSLLAPQPLASQHALLVGSLAANSWLDLVLQLVGIAEALMPVVLVFYLMARSGEPPSVMGLDAREPGRDLLRGAVLAAVIGGAGLALYLAAYHAGAELNVVPESLPAVWWRIPVLLLSALHDGLLEEILVIGYLLRRLDQLGWTPWKAILFAAVLRGSSATRPSPGRCPGSRGPDRVSGRGPPAPPRRATGPARPPAASAWNAGSRCRSPPAAARPRPRRQTRASRPAARSG